MSSQGLAHGPLGAKCLHVCVDMQAVFLPGSPWANTWMERVLPAIEELAGRHADRTVFTRFIPARDAGSAPGMWKRYWRKWESLTLEHIDPATLRLVPSLARLAPPARIIDKRVYSPWTERHFDQLLGSGEVDTLVVSVSGVSTDGTKSA